MYQTIIIGIFGFNVRHAVFLDSDVVNEDEAVGRGMKKFSGCWPDHRIIIATANDIGPDLRKRGWRKK